MRCHASRGCLVLLALACAFISLPACTAVVVQEPYVYEPAPPPQPVIVVPGQTYYHEDYGTHYRPGYNRGYHGGGYGGSHGGDAPSRQQVNRRLRVCNANYNNCMTNCNTLIDASQRALCINQCNAAQQQCLDQTTQ